MTKFDETFKLDLPTPTHLWMVDIVQFSAIKDAIVQEELIQNLFSCVYKAVDEISANVAKDKNLNKELSSDDATVTWTGDGAIVALKFPFDILTPLKLSYYFNYFWQKLKWINYQLKQGSNKALPKVHISIHSGECRWLKTPTLRSPLFEVSNCFGADINILVRISTFSTENGDFVVSEDYYQKVSGFLKKWQTPS